MALRGIGSLMALKTLADAAKKKSDAAKDSALEKRERRKGGIVVSSVPASQVGTQVPVVCEAKKPVPDFSGAKFVKKPSTATDVAGWFQDGLRSLYGPDLVLPDKKKWWGNKEKKIAKTLLSLYGEKPLMEAIFHFCSTWESRVSGSRGSLSGMPNIGLFWAMKDRIFNEVAGLIKMDTKVGAHGVGRARMGKDTDEYVAPKQPLGTEWGF